MRCLPWMLLPLAVACGGPEPSTIDPRFDDLRWTSDYPIDGDLDENGDLAVVTGRFGPLTSGDAVDEVTAFVTTWEDVLAVSADQLVPLGAVDGIGDSSIGWFGIAQDGMPVFDAFVLGEVSPPYGVTTLITHVPSDLEVPTSPSVTSEEAVTAAREVEDLEITDLVTDPVLGIFNGGLYLDEPTGSQLAWQVPLESATVWVDAEAGDVVWVDRDTAEALDLALYSAGNSSDKAALIGWDGATPTRIPWMDENGAVSGASPSAQAQRAFDNIHTVHDYYEDNHGYTGVDGAGLVQTTVYVHFGQPGYRNAFFSLSSLWIGDGANFLDVMGHEYTHGVVRFTAGLRYAAYSGALNESLADSFGAFIDTGDKWRMGEGLEGGPIRYMDNPPRKNHPSHWKRRKKISVAGSCSATLPRCSGDKTCIAGKCADLTADHGYVHKNSGIPNNATYLMSASPAGSVRRHKVSNVKVRSIGQDKVAAVMMDVLQLYLGPSSHFGHYARAMVAACKRHVKAAESGLSTAGIETKDCGAMINGLHAVGIHKGPDKDEDTVIDKVDGCPKDYDPEQEDADHDGIGDACDDVFGTKIKVVTVHSHSGDENNIHIVLQDEGMSETLNRVTPNSSRSRTITTAGELMVSVGRGGTVWETISCGYAMADGEYRAVYHEGFGLQTYGFNCWRTGPGIPPPDPTDEGDPDAPPDLP